MVKGQETKVAPCMVSMERRRRIPLKHVLLANVFITSFLFRYVLRTCRYSGVLPLVFAEGTEV